MRILQKGFYKGREFVVGKMDHSEEDILNREKTFDATIQTLSEIRKEADSVLYGEVSFLDKSIYGKRKAG